MLWRLSRLRFIFVTNFCPYDEKLKDKRYTTPSSKMMKRKVLLYLSVVREVGDVNP